MRGMRKSMKDGVVGRHAAPIAIGIEGRDGATCSQSNWRTDKRSSASSSAATIRSILAEVNSCPLYLAHARDERAPVPSPVWRALALFCAVRFRSAGGGSGGGECGESTRKHKRKPPRRRGNSPSRLRRPSGRDHENNC